MKILFVNAHIGKGGGQAIQTSLIIKELSKDHDVKLLTLKHKLNLVQPPCDIIYAGKFSFPFGFYHLYKGLKKIEQDYDIVVALDAYFSLPIVSLSKKPKVIRLGTDPVQELKFRNKRFYLMFYKLIFKHALKKYSAIVFNNKTLKNKYKEFNPYYVQNGYDLKKFNLESKDESRVRLNLPKNKLILLYTGKIIPTKNLEILFKTLSRLDDILLVLVGNKNEENHGLKYYNYLTRKYYNHLSKVKFVDELPNDEILYYLNAADIFVFPSIFEGSPNSVWEAMGSKRPVVCFDIPPHREIIKNKQTGFLFKTEDELVNYIKLLQNNKKLRDQIGNNAKQEMVKLHNINQTKNAYIKILKKVIYENNKKTGNGKK